MRLDKLDDDILRSEFVGQRLRKAFQGELAGAIQ
jgi:hypothetical protein